MGRTIIVQHTPLLSAAIEGALSNQQLAIGRYRGEQGDVHRPYTSDTTPAS